MVGDCTGAKKIKATAVFSLSAALTAIRFLEDTTSSSVQKATRSWEENIFLCKLGVTQLTAQLLCWYDGCLPQSTASFLQSGKSYGDNFHFGAKRLSELSVDWQQRVCVCASLSRYCVTRVCHPPPPPTALQWLSVESLSVSWRYESQAVKIEERIVSLLTFRKLHQCQPLSCI